jgi:hypothetical protein
MSNKINLDKYYTPTDIAKYCIDKTFDILKENIIGDIIEPSAGAGAFSLQLPSNCKSYDIKPDHESIIEQDYLELNIGYLKDRLIIGSPPFGELASLALQFYKKSVELGDYIAFILPISQLNNNEFMSDFELIYSEDLGKNKFSGRVLRCCFNIYRR